MAKEKELTISNTAVWDALKTPPTSALKAIQGGRLKGKTDINPQWRYFAMTQQFGVCGIGWKYVIDRTWSEVGSEGQVLAFAKVSLFVKVDGAWSDAIEGIGGSMQVEKETKGLYSSDECYKMAVTDALSVAMKMLGVAGDIYMGLWDGTKYRDAVEQPKTAQPKAQEPPKTPAPSTKAVLPNPLLTTVADYKKEIETALNLSHLKEIWEAATISKNKKEITVDEYESLKPIKDAAKERLK